MEVCKRTSYLTGKNLVTLKSGDSSKSRNLSPAKFFHSKFAKLSRAKISDNKVVFSATCFLFDTCRTRSGQRVKMLYWQDSTLDVKLGKISQVIEDRVKNFGLQWHSARLNLKMPRHPKAWNWKCYEKTIYTAVWMYTTHWWILLEEYQAISNITSGFRWSEVAWVCESWMFSTFRTIFVFWHSK